MENSRENPFYIADLSIAEFEYIPLLPLHWRVLSSSTPHCSYKSFIQDILDIILYLRGRDNSTSIVPATKFSVLGTYNLRTTWGSGMPLQTRRGEAWQKVSEFIMGLSIGHYERWPECPDLLRKQFKYLVELPFPVHSSSSASPEHQQSASSAGSIAVEPSRREHVFAFIGGMDLPGPEKACAVRTALYEAALLRDDVLFINSTAVYGADARFRDLNLVMHVKRLLLKSVFCLILPGRSYSTSFFFHAMHAGCIPILVNDWLVLPYPHVVPYQSFCLRVYQQDFLFNPHYVLNYIKSRLLPDHALLSSMRDTMALYLPLLSYAPVGYLSTVYRDLMAGDFYNANRDDIGATKTFSVVLPFELMLRELRYVGRPHSYYNNVPCSRFYFCEHRRFVKGNGSSASHMYGANISVGKDYHVYDNRHDVFLSHTLNRDFITRQAFLYLGDRHGSGLGVVKDYIPSNVTGGEADIPLERDMYQVSGLSFRQLFSRYHIRNISPYLCRHNKRLVGMYKMVFFMQCVRVLFPLAPGKFKSHDRVDMVNSSLLSYSDNNIDIDVGLPSSSSKTALPSFLSGLSKEEYEYVLSFHHIRRPPDYKDDIYPNPKHFLSRKHSASKVYDALSMMGDS